MVIIPLCLASVLLACEPNPIAVTESDNDIQISYTNTDNRILNELSGEVLLDSSNKNMLKTKSNEHDEYKIEEVEYQNLGFRQTFYSVEQGEISLGSGYNYLSDKVSNIDNVMHFDDDIYGKLPIYAIDINEVTNSGQNEKGTWNIYGSIIEITDGTSTWQGVIGDACGACSWDNRIDLWVYNNDISMDVSGLSWRYVRYGW